MPSIVHCEVAGEEKPPIVLLHGFTLDHQMWRSQIDTFQLDLKVIAVDIPGFGKSPTQTAANIQEVAIKIRNTVKTMTHEKPYILCGLSMGGYIALEMMRCFKSDISALILSNTEVRSDSEEEKKRRDQFIENIATNGGRPFLESVAPILTSSTTVSADPLFPEKLFLKMTETSDESLIDGLKIMRNRPDYLDIAKKFEQPTLVLGGSDDKLCSLKDVEDTAAAFPNSQLEVIENTGHLTPMEDPVQFNRIVYEFLRSHSLIDG